MRSRLSASRQKKKESEYWDLSRDISDIVDIHTQSDRCHDDTKGYVKMTAQSVYNQLCMEKGYDRLSFVVRTINSVLNRLDYTLKKVRKSLPLKRIAETELIFENIAEHRKASSCGILQISVDVKDKVRVGALSREGYSRCKEAVESLDKDMYWETKLVPLGILEIKSGISTVVVGNSQETSDFIVDGLEKWFELRKEAISEYHTIEIYLDNGPAVNSKRTQFINRIMEFACITGLKIHLLYYPPYHSKYNPVERVWAAVEQYWNGTLLDSVQKTINTLKNVTWKAQNLNVIVIDKLYQTEVTLTPKEMQKRELLIIRKPTIEKWDVWIKPSFQMGGLFFS